MRNRALATLVPLLAGALLAGGCLLGRTREARTFVFDPLAVAQAGAPAAVPVAVVVVERVSIPAWIDRPQVTGRTRAGDIVTDEYALWGEPVAKGIQRVVAENLAALAPERRFLAAPYRPQPVDHLLEITLVEATRQADGSMLLEARWDVLSRKGEVLARRRSSHRATPTPPGAAGGVAGANQALLELSREIADMLRTLPAAEVPPAPAPSPVPDPPLTPSGRSR